jgi:hypothetical protein
VVGLSDVWCLNLSHGLREASGWEVQDGSALRSDQSGRGTDDPDRHAPRSVCSGRQGWAIIGATRIAWWSARINLDADVEPG